ncbi:MAG TPA: YggT family protein [Dehalococcoidia bacterium]|nr:YggT family protein [Dehalococcoidia bacterium]
MDTFIEIVIILCQVLAIIIFVRAILSWFATSPNSQVVLFLDRITEPILAPLRRIVPRLGMADITPMIAIIILLLIASLLS